MKSPSMRWIALVLGLAIVVTAAVVGLRMLRPGTELTAEFDSAVGLYPGSDVQVLGVPVGKVTAVQPVGEKVQVTMKIDEGRKIAPDTGAVVVAPTLVSDRYVQLTEAWVSGPSIKDGTHIARTAVPVEIDEMYRSLADIGEQLGPNGVNRNGALSDFLQVLAKNLDGQGVSINRMIGNFSDASTTIAGFDQDFFATVRNLDTLNETLLKHDKGVAGANEKLALVAEYLAEDRENLAASITELGKALGMLEGFVKDNRAALKKSVDGLRGPTQVLVNQRRSLAEAVRLIPLALQNFINAYDPASGTLQGRGNLNELTVWSKDGKSARTSGDAPPLLLPGVDGGQ
ncbi:MCE family protein [Pimelobacter simplex]|uniref:MCE family protein n=1 Tax=Nocardioides simplex TaxID=2045 RepID=A0A7J5DQZ0_NOCSI|nr:MCE family protein [Pimelobacter simplex]KAB2807166.1 MCE family protein [Pimelobacter simplex]